MLYIVTEIQSTGETSAEIVTKHATRNEADSKFFQVLAAAAVSAVPIHTATLCTDEGCWLESRCYKHPAPEPAPEPEEEAEE